MADKMTKEQRHKCMASIHSKDTKPEMVVRHFLFANGFRYRIHARVLPGSPDIVMSGLRTVIFVNGCFWHGHDCKFYSVPKTNTDFWKAKIERNIERDKRERLELRDAGWHVVQIWECELRPKQREATLQGLLRTLNLILLENKEVKLYSRPEEEGLMAAEENVGYGARGRLTENENEGMNSEEAGEEQPRLSD